MAVATLSEHIRDKRCRTRKALEVAAWKLKNLLCKEKRGSEKGGNICRH